VSESDLIVEPNYYLVRKRVTASRKNVDAVWNWCIENLVTI